MPTDADDGEEVFAGAIVRLWEAQGFPRLSETFLRVERHRSTGAYALTTAVSQQWLPALESLLTGLDRLEQQVPDVWDGALLVLVQRLRGDVETSLDAILSGARGTASDAARDLVEVEFLLRDFVADATRASQWMAASRRVLMAEFSPAKLRQREADRRHPGEKVTLPDEEEYIAHSQITHPTPSGGRAREVAVPESEWPLPLALAELLIHTSRCLDALSPLLAERRIETETLAAFVAATATANDQLQSLASQMPEGVLPGYTAERKPIPKGWQRPSSSL